MAFGNLKDKAAAISAELAAPKPPVLESTETLTQDAPKPASETSSEPTTVATETLHVGSLETATGDEPSSSEAQSSRDGGPKETTRFGATVIELPCPSVYPHIKERMENTSIVGYDVFFLDCLWGAGREDTRAVQDIVQVLDHATDGMDIAFYCNSPGGSVGHMAEIASAMKRSKAHITTIAVGSVASAMTVIWAFGHTRVVWPSASFMFHSSSHGSYGHSLDVAQSAAILVDYMREHLVGSMVSEGLITDAEMELILRKEDVFISAAVMKARLEAIDKATTEAASPAPTPETATQEEE